MWKRTRTAFGTDGGRLAAAGRHTAAALPRRRRTAAAVVATVVAIVVLTYHGRDRGRELQHRTEVQVRAIISVLLRTAAATTRSTADLAPTAAVKQMVRDGGERASKHSFHPSSRGLRVE